MGVRDVPHRQRRIRCGGHSLRRAVGSPLSVPRPGDTNDGRMRSTRWSLARLHAHATTRPRFGYRRPHVLLDRNAWPRPAVRAVERNVGRQLRLPLRGFDHSSLSVSSGPSCGAITRYRPRRRGRPRTGTAWQYRLRIQPHQIRSSLHRLPFRLRRPRLPLFALATSTITCPR